MRGCAAFGVGFVRGTGPGRTPALVAGLGSGGGVGGFVPTCGVFAAGALVVTHDVGEHENVRAVDQQ